MRLKIRHTTRYRFAEPASYGMQQLRKTPKSSHQQRVLSWETTLTGGQQELSFSDHHNNVVELISFERQTPELMVESIGEVEIEETHGVTGRHLGPSPLWLYQGQSARTKPGPGVRALARDVAGEGLDQLHTLSAAIRDLVAYEVGASQPDWTAEDAIEAGRGVCQDHTHVFLSAARHLGHPARYVSGYLMLDDRTSQEAMHAWAEAHVDGLGWVGFDVSNGISPDQRYVRVATGLDYGDAAPVSGVRIGGLGEALDVQIDVAQQ